MNLQNTGRKPVPPDEGGGDGFSQYEAGRYNENKEREENELRRKRIAIDEEDFIMMLSQWVVNNN